MQDLAHAPANLVDGVRHAEPELARNLDVGSESGDVAAAGRTRDIGTGTGHPGADTGARLDRVAQRDVDERAERAHVADRREAGEQRVARVRDPRERLLRAGAHHERRVSLAGVELADHVGVQVDQTGHDRRL